MRTAGDMPSGVSPDLAQRRAVGDTPRGRVPVVAASKPLILLR